MTPNPSEVDDQSKYLIRLVLVIVGLATLIGIVYMNAPLYRWKILTTFDHEIESLEFISPSTGWLSEFIPNQERKDDDFWSEKRLGTNRLQLTQDGGRSWKIIYQATADGIFKQLRYVNTLKWLLGIKVIFPDRIEQRPKGMLYKSLDGGYQWEKIGDLPQGGAYEIYFLNEQQGYFVGDNLFFTSDGGKQWKFLATIENRLILAKRYYLGPNHFLYFINQGIVTGINPWKNQTLNLVLPPHFQPREVLALPSKPIVYLIGELNSKWTLLGYENGKRLSQEVVPIHEADFNVSAFTYGENLINLVGPATWSFFRPYYFYVRNSKGWYQESLSGFKNFELFAYCGNHAWAVRIALLKGHRELLRRQGVD